MRRILLMFFASGALGLGYQVLWSKLVLLFLGVSSWSYAIVLAAFMAGLALGSRWLGRLADRVSSPLALFGWLELGIGALAVAQPAMSRLASDAYMRWASGSALLPGDPRLLLVKAAVAGILLVPPTTLMGGTFPALLRHAATSVDLVGRRASQLYAINAAGAVAGALAMALVVLPALGLRASTTTLALGNVVVGLSALAIARRRSGGAPATRAADAAAPASRPEPARLILWVAFVAGALSFALEIAWTRAFAIVMGSSTQSFAAILAAFITGIAAGSAILARLGPRARPVVAFGWIQVIVGALILLPLPLLPYVPWLLGRVAAHLPGTEAGFVLHAFVRMGACLLLMLLPALGLGMSIPLLVQALARDERRVATDAGRVYAANTAGNVFGALAAGMVALPLLGVERLITVVAVASALAGAVVVALSDARVLAVSDRARRMAPLAAAASVAALALVLPAWDAAWLTFSPYRRPNTDSFATTRVAAQSRRVVYMHDDPAANVIVLTSGAGPDVQVAMLVNGKPDASVPGDQPTQLMLGHLPLLLRPASKSVLVIGLASGVTSGAVLCHPVDRLDVVDIVRSMPAATAWFDEWNGRPLADPRTRFIADDARSYLVTTSPRYDVIISEPSNPWTAGTGSLYSTELYRRAADRLSPGGVFAQWLQAYELSDELVQATLRSFCGAFPHVTLWQTGLRDVLVIGSREPLEPDFDAMNAALREPKVRASIAKLGMWNAGDVLFLQRMSEPGVDWLASRALLENTDDNLLLEHEAPRDLFLGAHPRLMDELDERLFVAPALLWRRAVDSGAADPREISRTMGTHAFGNPPLWRAWETLPPPTEEAHADVEGALASGDPAAVARALGRHAPSLAAASLLDPAFAEAWIARLAAWRRAAPPEAARLLAVEQADLLGASRRPDEALALLGELVSPGSSADELLTRACRIAPDERCDAFARRMLEITRDERIEEFLRLRAAKEAR